jgi:hypothetical protein
MKAVTSALDPKISLQAGIEFSGVDKFVIVILSTVLLSDLAEGGTQYEDRWTLPLRVHYV